jgi:hypothetical protein
MALAERHDLPILTFDFEHFRATRPRRGYWRLVVDEARYAESAAGSSDPRRGVRARGYFFGDVAR